MHEMTRSVSMIVRCLNLNIFKYYFEQLLFSAPKVQKKQITCKGLCYIIQFFVVFKNFCTFASELYCLFQLSQQSG